MLKVALCLIVKGSDDEAPLLDKCLASVKDHVDGIFIDINAPKGKKQSKKVIDVAKKYGADIALTIWENNFVKARNDNFARVPKDYTHILWLDSDDTVDNPEKIKAVAAIMPSEVSGVYICYDYDHDEYGNVSVAHYVARLVRNNSTYAWKSSFDDADVAVHETLNEVRATNKVMNDEFKIIHNSTNDRRNSSLVRNIELLEGMYKKNPQNPDPRILFYLATHYYDARAYNQVKPLLEHYLTMSGWAEERAQAWIYLGDIYKFMGDVPKARGCYTKALAENPDDPMAYVELGELEMEQQLWAKAASWLEMAVSKKIDHTVAVMRPLESTYRAYKGLANTYANMGGKSLRKASKWVTEAIKLRPQDPELQRAKEYVELLQKTVKLNESVIELVKELKEQKEYNKILPLLDKLPLHLQSAPTTVSIRRFYERPKTWDNKSIAIVCGPSALGHWGPWSLREGIGGSEEAVIQLSNELTKLGWGVTVYATPGQRAGQHDGVDWRHYWEFNPKDQFDVIIGWRNPQIFDHKFAARKKYLWLHDVIDAPELTEERLNNLDKVIFVSQYHADLYDIPEGKKLASGNGIDPQAFEGVEIERNPKKVVYMSAHERGQELLQRIWPNVLKEVPDAEAHCYYGWAGYDHINRDNPERIAWKEKLISEQKTLKNFTDHGKIGHKEIIEEIFSAGVWAYPTAFDECYCISAVKAQAGGAWPVYSNHAALKDMVAFGDKVEIGSEKIQGHDVGVWSEDKITEFTDKLINRLKNPVTDKERKEMMDWARQTKSWESTAKQWDTEMRGRT